MELGLTGRACAVTGASRGIGREISRQLAGEGAAVLLIGRDTVALDEAAAVCVDAALEAERYEGSDEDRRAAARSRVATLALDVTAEDAGERILAAAEEHFGRLDVLVNNASVARWTRIDDIPDEEWRYQFELNVMAPMRAMKAVIPPMAERGWGRIVNVCSTSGRRPSELGPHYSVAKAAEFSLSRWFAEQYSEQGVLINAVSPGPVMSEMWKDPGGLLEQLVELGVAENVEDAEIKGAAGQPIPRFGEPAEVAAVVLFLCSERASFVTGAAWAVDGGRVPI